MLCLPVLSGYCTIQLYTLVSGAHRWEHSQVWAVCGNALVDECNYAVLDQDRWLKQWNVCTSSFYAVRNDKQNGKRVHVLMARELLGLPRGGGFAGDRADHQNHDTLDNTVSNLRVATPNQNGANRRNGKSRCRFKGIFPANTVRVGFQTKIVVNQEAVFLPTVEKDVDAAFMYNYAAHLVFGEFAYFNQIPEDEWPSEERQEELWQMVLKKLREVGLLPGA